MIKAAVQSNGTAWQAARYVAVGAVVYAIDLGVFALLGANSVHPAPANVAAKVTAAGAGFLLHRHFTFRVAQNSFRVVDVGRYATLLAANTAATTLVLSVLTGVFGLPATPSKVGVDFLAILVAFLASKFLVFGDNPPTKGA